MESFLSFFCGALSAAILAFVFSFELKGFIKLGLNLIVGAIVLSLLSITGVMPFNALNAFIVGILGLPGLIAIYIIVTFL